MEKFLLLVGVLFVAWMCARPAPAGHWSGRPGTVSVQTSTGLPAAWTREGLTYVPLARFAVKAVVLSRCRFARSRARPDLAGAAGEGLGLAASGEGTVADYVTRDCWP